MAASETVRLRLQFDYPPPGAPHCTSFWLLIDLNGCRVVTDLISLIRQRFGFSSGALLGLYLEGALLPPAESARLVRDNDCLRCAGGRRGGAGAPAHTRGAEAARPAARGAASGSAAARGPLAAQWGVGDRTWKSPGLLSGRGPRPFQPRCPFQPRSAERLLSRAPSLGARRGPASGSALPRRLAGPSGHPAGVASSPGAVSPASERLPYRLARPVLCLV